MTIRRAGVSSRTIAGPVIARAAGHAERADAWVRVRYASRAGQYQTGDLVTVTDTGGRLRVTLACTTPNDADPTGGEAYTVTWPVVDALGAAVDLTGGRFFLQLQMRALSTSRAAATPRVYWGLHATNGAAVSNSVRLMGALLSASPGTTVWRGSTSVQNSTNSMSAPTVVGGMWVPTTNTSSGVATLGRVAQRWPLAWSSASQMAVEGTEAIAGTAHLAAVFACNATDSVQTWIEGEFWYRVLDLASVG